MDWLKIVFLHTGWASKYDGTEAPEGGHAYLKNSVGVEADNFRDFDGWCYGYAPVSRTGEARTELKIPKAGRTLNISKLGATPRQNQIEDVTIIWTARNPERGPVIVGIYEAATVYRFMPGQGESRPFISKARASNCRLVPQKERTFDVIHKVKGFPGMAAAWFPGLHADGPAKQFLISAEKYIATLKRYSTVA